MSEEIELKPREPRRRRRWLIMTAGALLLFGGLYWYLNSAGFEDRVRERVIAELERATGGRVDLPAFDWHITRLEFVAKDLTIHGTESPGEAAYAHVDYLKVRLKVISFFGREIGLRSVEAQHPVLHITVRSDGSTNQPAPVIAQKPAQPGSMFNRIFALAIDRLDVNNGMFEWNEKRVPIDIHADDVSAHMTYAFADKSYDGVLSVGKTSAVMAGPRPLVSNAEVHLGIKRDAVDIKSLKWASTGSKLESSGRITRLADPKLELAYNMTVSMAELGSFTSIPGMRSGQLELHATGKFWWDKSLQCFSSGDAILHDMTWQDANVRVPGMNARSKFSLDGTRIVLSNIHGTLLGGAATGSAEIKNWTHHSEHPGHDALAELGSGRFQVRNIQAAGVALVFSSPRLPLEKLNAHGLADGTVEVEWRGSLDRADAALHLNVTATPIVAGPPGLPVSGHLTGIYHMSRNEMDFSKLELDTASTHVTASGVLGSESNRLDVRAQTENLHEWDPVLSAFGKRPELPLRLAGKASFNGAVSGKFAMPTMRGHLELASFESLLRLSPSPNAKPAHVYWDTLSADVQYGPHFISVVNGKVGRGSARVLFSGRSTLVDGQIDDTSGFQVQVEVHSAALSDVQAIASTNYPLTGTLNLVANASGTPVYFRGSGSFDLEGGTVYGEQFKSLRSGARFTNEHVQLLNAVFTQNGAQLTGSGSYTFSDQSFTLDARGDNIELAHINSLQHPRLSLAGHADFQLKGSGTLQSPTLDGTFKISQLTGNGEVIGDLTANAVTRGRELEITGKSEMRGAELEANGRVHLEGDFPGKITLNLNKVDFDSLLRAYLDGRVTGHSSANGTIEITGQFRHPSSLDIGGTVQQLTAEIEHIQLRNEGPVVFSYSAGTLDLKNSHITGENTDLYAEGTVALTSTSRMDVRANGRANLQLFQGLSPGLSSSGTAAMQLVITGTQASPTLNGEVQIEHAALSLADVPNGLSEVNGTLVFNENRLQIRSLTARTGGGNLEVGGFVAYRRGLFFDLTAKGKDVRLRYPPGVSSAADADLHLAGTLQSSLLSGTVMVTRFGVNPKFDFSQYLARAKQVPSTMTTNSVVDNMRLDVHIVSTPQLEVETALAKITGDADLHIRGTLGHPAVLGRVNIVEGDVYLSGTKYHLERGDITFRNPVRIEPILNIEASARVQEYDITIGLHGTPDKLEKQRSFRSDPPLPEADIIALIALGRTREDTALSRPITETSSDATSNAILGQALNQVISSRAQRLFGVSRIKIDPQVGGLESNPNARLTLEEQVNNNITLTYVTNLAASAQQVIQAEYLVNKNLSIVVIRDQNGVLGFEIRMRQRKK